MVRIESLYRQNFWTECIRGRWKKADQQDMNDEKLVLELIEVQKTQKNSFFSAEEICKDDVEYIGEIQIEEDPSDTISMTKKLKQFSINQFFSKNNISLISILWVLNLQICCWSAIVGFRPYCALFNKLIIHYKLKFSLWILFSSDKFTNLCTFCKHFRPLNICLQKLCPDFFSKNRF